MARILIAAKQENFPLEVQAALEGQVHDYRTIVRSDALKTDLIEDGLAPDIIVVSPSIAGHNPEGMRRFIRLLGEHKDVAIVVSDNAMIRSTAQDAKIEVVSPKYPIDLLSVVENILRRDC